MLQRARLVVFMDYMVESYMISAYIEYMADYHENVSSLSDLNFD